MSPRTLFGIWAKLWVSFSVKYEFNNDELSKYLMSDYIMTNFGNLDAKMVDK